MRIFPSVIAAWFLFSAFAINASAQQWARDMFQQTSHDFGKVAHGSNPTYKFSFTNKYKEDVHVAAVRSSCGCTTPSIEKQWVKSLEMGGIFATFNASAFTGEKSSVITVVFDRPYHAEVQLNIKGDIRTDVQLVPAEIEFPRTIEGAGSEVTVQVTHIKNSNWTINDVRSPFEHISVKLHPKEIVNGAARYKLTIRLKETAPVGSIQQHVTLVTSDGESGNISIPLRAEIQSVLSVTPTAWTIGKIKVGTQASKRLIVKGPAPFLITKVSGPDARVECILPGEKKGVHLLDLIFKAGDQIGNIQQTVRVETDMEGGRAAECVLIGEVVQ